MWVLKQNNGNRRKLGHIPELATFEGQEGVLESQDGTRMNSQVKVQDEINLHNQEKKAINVS